MKATSIVSSTLCVFDMMVCVCVEFSHLSNLAIEKVREG